MASDGRYVYQSPITASYDYATYPPPPPQHQPYDTSVSQPRQMRPTPSTQPLSPHQPYLPPSHSYQPPSPYAPSPYMAHPQHPPPPPPQWPTENWSHYNQTYAHPNPPPPPHFVPDGHYAQSPMRQDTVPSSSNDSRGYQPLPPPSTGHPDARRIDERPPPTTTNLQQPTPAPTRRRDRESPSTASPVPTSGGFDFMKMLHSYRLIIDDAADLSSGPGRPPPPVELLDRMLNSAARGAQTLNFIRTTVTTGANPSPGSTMLPDSGTTTKHEPDEGPHHHQGPVQVSSSSSLTIATMQNGSGGAGPKPQKVEDSSGGGQEGQTCLGCKATSTPEWRRGPMGPRTLCNACGLVYAKIIKRRVRDQASKVNGDRPPQDIGDDSPDDSDEDEEYDSQGRRSEAGDS